MPHRASFLCLLMLCAATACGTTITMPHGAPASVFCRPDGLGDPLAGATDASGVSVDATLTATCVSDDFWNFGEPLAHVPAEDIWLASTAGTLLACAPLHPDGPTDADGVTTFSGPFALGGRAGHGDLALYIDGSWQAAVGDLALNSPDLNGDGVVNLTDVGLFNAALTTHVYDAAADLHWDGVVNISDAGLLASAIGAGCP